jgi:UDP-N-acetylmuramoyl-L-alanyl-D-glutamate--2,6-diaminopimelate ligase
MINIQSDSRKIRPGDTFIALRGISSDGHSYINKAIELGATKIIAEEGNYSVETIIVPDTRKYLEEYLKENYNRYLNEMNIIGVTGTNGKTTTAKLLHDVLNSMGSKTAYIGTIGFYIKDKICNLANTTVDICDTYDLMMKAYDAGCNNIIMEISSHALAMNRVSTLQFDYAIFTNLTQDHLDFHKTMGNYALAKQILFKHLKDTGVAIVNDDDKYKEYFLLKENKNLTYGFESGDLKIVDYNMTQDKTTFSYEYKGEVYNTESKLLGKYNVYNLLAIISTLTAMGLKQEKILEYIPNLKAPVGRMEIIKYKTNSIIIDYAHTPDAIEKVMSAISGLVEGNIYVVFGCTGDRDRLKRPIMTEYVANHSSYFIITNDDPHYEEPTQIVDDMTKDLEKDNYEVCLDREEAIVKGINLLKDKDVLFILGKGHEEAIIIRDKRIPFNDHQVVVDYLEKLNGGEN